MMYFISSYLFFAYQTRKKLDNDRFKKKKRDQFLLDPTKNLIFSFLTKKVNIDEKRRKTGVHFNRTGAGRA